MNVTAIQNDLDNEHAIDRIQELWECPPGSEGAIERDLLSALVDGYESTRYPSTPANPLELVKFRLKEKGWSQNQLGKAVGCSSGRMSEILTGKRALTVDMIRKLSHALEIPPDVLVHAHTEKATTQWIKVSTDLVDRIKAEVSDSSVDVWVCAAIEAALMTHEDSPT